MILIVGCAMQAPAGEDEPDCDVRPRARPKHPGSRGWPAHSHSIVAGGLPLMS